MSEVDAQRRKRLGQFFTGDRLALLLAALANASESRSIIDPMGGSGDMIAACLNAGAAPDLAALIEIDPAAASDSERRFAGAGHVPLVVAGDAFDRTSWRCLPDAWDLVITNPPYVRYQSGKSAFDGNPALPTAAEIRAALLDQVDHLTSLEDTARQTIRECILGYSGLADLAVPSWLLCAAHVAIGGRIALVVPDTWLSRDYAVPVLLLLRRLFEIEYVVEDADASWFDEALVRTTLVVAQRVQDRGGPFLPGGHLRIKLPRAASDTRSLVGACFPDASRPEEEFARWAAQQRADHEGGHLGPVQASWSDESDLIQTLRRSAMPSQGGRNRRTNSPVVEQLPERFRDVLGGSPDSVVPIDRVGWSVGQGLRTGANDFFYVAVKQDGVRSAILPDSVLALPDEVVRTALRRQAELPSHDERVATEPLSKVLILDGWALPEDMARVTGPRPWMPMGGDLARLVREAAMTRYTRGDVSVLLPELTAVSTNVRRYAPRAPRTPERFWYQLPDLAARHKPALYMARVNGRAPKPYLNQERALIVDANFSTFWPDDGAMVGAYAMLALLSSSWVRCLLELTGTVLGGGALKVEATHLRRLLLPALDGHDCDELDRLGQALIEPGLHSSVQAEIDLTVLGAAGFRHRAEAVTVLADQLLSARSAKVNAG